MPRCLQVKDVEMNPWFDVLHLAVLPKLMLRYVMKKMIFQVIVDVAAPVRCNCPILVLLRWDAEMLSLTLMTEAVEDGSAIHAKYPDAAIFDPVDDHDDAMIHVNVVVVLSLDEVVVDVPL